MPWLMPLATLTSLPKKRRPSDDRFSNSAQHPAERCRPGNGPGNAALFSVLGICPVAGRGGGDQLSLAALIPWPTMRFTTG